jgi:hypothetical protein
MDEKNGFLKVCIVYTSQVFYLYSESGTQRKSKEKGMEL